MSPLRKLHGHIFWAQKGDGDTQNRFADFANPAMEVATRSSSITLDSDVLGDCAANPLPLPAQRLCLHHFVAAGAL
jgi:hypothetical protein